VRATLLSVMLLSSILFNGCTQPQKVYVSPKLPTLRECRVKRVRLRAYGDGERICYARKEYAKLKDTVRRLRVCNDLLNRQNRDFNARFARKEK